MNLKYYSRDLSPTAVFICTVLGAGFATGNELCRYFVQYGLWGIVGIAISSVLFGISAQALAALPFTDLGEFLKSRFGAFAGIASGIILVFTLVLCSAMIACGGELISQYFGCHAKAGNIISAIITLLFLLKGAEGLSLVSRLLCLPMLFAAVIIGICLLRLPSEPIYPPNRAIGAAMPLVYVSYNILSAAPVIIGCKSRKIGILSGIGIAAIALSLALPLHKYYGYISSEPMPVLALLPKSSSLNALRLLYLALLVSAILTTAVSTGQSAADAIKGSLGHLSPLAATLGALALSFVGFADIVARVYFVFGIAGIILLWAILTKNNHVVNGNSSP